MTAPARRVDEPFDDAAANAAALAAEWAGPGPGAPLVVAHRDQQTARLSFHLRGTPAQLAHILTALRDYNPTPTHQT